MAQWIPGDEITADKLNENRGFGNIAARAYRSGNQTILDNTETKVEFNAESYDKGGDYDHITNFRFTAPKAGIYLIQTNISWTSVSNEKEYGLKIKKNGTTYLVQDSHASLGTSIDFHHRTFVIADLAANDFIEVFVIHLVGASTFLYGAEDVSYLEVIRIA